MKYFAIDNGKGYPSRFVCERCARLETIFAEINDSEPIWRQNELEYQESD